MIFDMPDPEDFEELMYQRANSLMGAWVVLTYGRFDFRFLINLPHLDIIHLLPRAMDDNGSAQFMAEQLRRSRERTRVVLLAPRESLVPTNDDVVLIAELAPVLVYTTNQRLLRCTNAEGMGHIEMKLLHCSGGPFHGSHRHIIGPDGKPINVPEVA